MSNTPDNLASLRREIDSIDDELHDLLMRRAEIVGEIGRKKKASSGGPPFRPAREAQLLRRLLARHRGALPDSVVVRIWREIVAASTRLQGDFSVGYCPIEGHGSALRLAQGEFGLDANVNRFESAAQVVYAVGRGDVSVGIVPLAHVGESAGWWSGADMPEAVRVVARLPWLNSPDTVGAGAYVVASIVPEESGDDRSVFTFVSEPEVSRGKVSELAAQNGLDIADQAVADRADPQARVHFIDVAGFLTADDTRVRGLASLLDGAELRWLGAYAAPSGGTTSTGTE